MRISALTRNPARCTRTRNPIAICSNNLTPYAFPVFIVWRTIYKNGKLIRKERAVVDIRGLNRATVTNIYSIPLQSDIISLILEY